MDKMGMGHSGKTGMGCIGGYVLFEEVFSTIVTKIFIITVCIPWGVP
jgi:hypothetical protein